ncbi:MAG TPA: FtsX-like permease family protein [Thermoleophilaceae bacterium]|nr:FtsX-like permease family protein [Thermoleophilaceae bacterium]
MRRLSSLSGRSLRARPLRALLTTAGILLGVALMFGVLLLTATIDSTFRNLFDSVYGKADLVVATPDDAGGLPGGTLERVRATEGVRQAQGALFSVVVTARGGHELNLNAVDPAEPDTAGVTYVSGRRIRSGAEIELEEGWANERGLGVGERTRLATPTGVRAFRVVGLFRFSRSFGFGGEGFGTIPLETAREVFDRPRGVDEIRVVVAEAGSVAEVQRALRRALGKGVSVETPQGKSEEVSEQLQALNVVLVFFAAMGLFVGSFLIFNSFQITVLQRQRELGMLRTLGASRRQVRRLILREAIALGVLGTALGLGAGALIAVGLVALLGAIGFPVSGLAFSTPGLVAAAVGGIAVTLLGALVPAVRAGRTSPIRALLGVSESRRPPRPSRALLGAAVTALGLGGVFWLASAEDAGGAPAIAGGLGVILIFTGVSLAAPFLISPLVRVLAWPARRLAPIEGRLASDSARANPGRTAATASGLMIGLALVTAFGSLGSSFLGTVQDEFDTAFARDFTIQPRGLSPGAGPQQTISPRLLERVRRVPGVEVAAAERFLFTEEVLDGAGEGLLLGLDPERYGRLDDSAFAGGRSEEEVLRGLAAGGVTVGEAIAKEEGVAAGDTVVLVSPAGRRRVEVAGVVETSIFGGQTVGMSLELIEELYGIERDSDIAVKAASQDVRDDVERELEALVERDYPNLQVLSNDELKDEIESQVNQQFGFFNALLFVAVLVSLFGVINTLLMNVLERTREIGVLRALGSSRWQVRRAIGIEGLLLSMTGALLGLAVGLVLGWVFVQGIQTAVPTVSYSAPWGTIVAVGIAGVVLGLLASLLPARRAARMDVIEALQYE